MTLPPLVVADTSPINYLLRIEHIDILPAMYGVVFIPLEVHLELLHAGSPAAVRAWASNIPSWVKIESPRRLLNEHGVDALDAGEAQAISLALELNAGLLLIDDRPGRIAATKAGLQNVGTLGVLADAAHIGLIDFELAIAKLQETNFHTTLQIIQDARARARRT